MGAVACTTKKYIHVNLVSKSGETIQIFHNRNISGETLIVEWEEIKNGGCDTLRVTLNKDADIVYYADMQLFVYLQNTLLTSGYVTVTPSVDSYSNNIELECYGWMHKLEKVPLDQTVTDMDLTTIISLFNYALESVDITLDLSNIDLPDITASFDFSDTTLFDAVEDVVSVANNDIKNHEYRWWISPNKVFYIQEIQEGSKYFEGWHYQNPEVELLTDNIINILKMFSYYTNEEDEEIFNYVLTVEDEESKSVNGENSKTAVVPNSVDADTIEYIGKSVVAAHKDPIEQLTLLSFINVSMEFKKHKLNNRPTERWSEIASCDTLNNWSFDDGIEYSLDDTHVLTGNLSLKLSLDNNPVGVKATLTPEKPLYTLKKIALNIYFLQLLNLVIRFYSEDGTYVEWSRGKATSDLIVTTAAVEIKGDMAVQVSETDDGDLYVLNNSEERHLGLREINEYSDQELIVNLTQEDEEVLQVDSIPSVYNEWFKLSLEIKLFSLSRIEFIINQKADTSFWIDSIIGLFDGPVEYEAIPATITNTINGVDIFSDVVFGEEPLTLISELSEDTEPYDNLYKSFIKEK